MLASRDRPQRQDPRVTARGAARRSGPALVVALCLLAFEAHAQDCTIDNADLSGALKSMPDVLAVQVSKRRDPDSDEPVLRQLVDYADGTTLVLEQQNCLMHNLRVTLLSRESMPSETGLRRLGTVLGMTPVWTRYFARYDPVAVAIGEPKSPEFTSMKASGRPVQLSPRGPALGRGR